MPSIMCPCSICGMSFPSGIGIAPGASATLYGNISQCPNCGSMEQVPDGTFRATVEGIIDYISQSTNPIQTAKEVLEELEITRVSPDLQRLKNVKTAPFFRKWVPDTPQKLAAYIAIIYTIYKLLIQQPTANIEYNQTFLNQYYQYNQLIINPPAQQKLGPIPNQLPIKEKKIGRNETCPCGSGKKYKKCCLLKKTK